MSTARYIFLAIKQKQIVNLKVKLVIVGYEVIDEHTLKQVARFDVVGSTDFDRDYAKACARHECERLNAAK